MIYPPKLKAGDKVYIVGPAGVLSKNDLEPAIELLRSWGLLVKVGNHIFNQHHYFAGTDDQRCADFQNALDDPDVAAIFCARGGYGTGRILDQLSFDKFIIDPKWIVGFSDITLLHSKLHGMGIASIHGPVARQLGGAGAVDGKSVDSLKEGLFLNRDIEYSIEANKLNRTGTASGQVIGGNLTLLCNNIGTDSDINFANKILFMEEVGERLYAIDRYLNQLERSGRLQHLAGMIVGQFTDIKNIKSPLDRGTYQIIEEYTKGYEFPVAYGFESGHEKRNLSIPISFNCELNVSNSGCEVRFFKDPPLNN